MLLYLVAHWSRTPTRCALRLKHNKTDALCKNKYNVECFKKGNGSIQSHSVVCTDSVQSRSVPSYRCQYETKPENLLYQALALYQVGTEPLNFPECTPDGAICLN